MPGAAAAAAVADMKVDNPPVKRYVTGHDASGKAIIVDDTPVQQVKLVKDAATFGLLWSTDKAPASNTDPRDGSKPPVFSGRSHNPNGGSVLRMVDVPPGSVSPMHRTQSLDYGVVIWGHVELELDSGEKRVLHPSDVCVQRGTNHLWRNVGKSWARILFVLLDAEAVEIGGRKLDDEGFPDLAE